MITKCKKCDSIISFRQSDLHKMTNIEFHGKKDSTSLSKKMGYCKYCFDTEWKW